LRQSSEERERE
jgi:hypothetical protein